VSAALNLGAPWKHQPDGSIYASDGTIVVYPRVEAECGRKGDYYECNRFMARARVRVDPRRLSVLLAAPDLLAALTQLAFMARTSGTPTPELLRACEGAEALVAKTGELHG
jgi:hypothetical protein